MDEDNKFRKFCAILSQHWAFEVFISIFIIGSSAALASDSPLTDPGSELIKYFMIFDLVTAIIFLLEALIKIVAFGFIKNGESSYLRNPWNVLDFTLMIISIVQETLSVSGAMSTLKVLRLLRILRPVRLIAKN